MGNRKEDADVFNLNPDNGDGSDDDPSVEAEVQSLSPAMPGWFACYKDPENDNGFLMFAIASFAIVEVTEEDGSAYRVVRPYAAAPNGEIEDVYDFPDFLCLVGPGQDPRSVAADAREAQQSEDADNQEKPVA